MAEINWDKKIENCTPKEDYVLMMAHVMYYGGLYYKGSALNGLLSFIDLSEFCYFFAKILFLFLPQKGEQIFGYRKKVTFEQALHILLNDSEFGF